MTTTPKWFYNIKQRCLNKNNPLYKNYGGRGIQYKLTTYLDLIKYLGEKAKLILNEYKKGLIK